MKLDPPSRRLLIVVGVLTAVHALAALVVAVLEVTF